MTRQVSLPEMECACAGVRRAARLVTQLYSREMGAMEPPQYALLTALRELPGIGQTPLGKALGFDKTTLSRNLRVLRKNGWIEPSGRGFALTAAGIDALSSAKPGWLEAQRKLKEALEPGDWDLAIRIFQRIALAAATA